MPHTRLITFAWQPVLLRAHGPTPRASLVLPRIHIDISVVPIFLFSGYQDVGDDNGPCVAALLSGRDCLHQIKSIVGEFCMQATVLPVGMRTAL